jgi:hypothetical protein
MKYLILIAALFLTGCFKNLTGKCPGKDFRQYTYMDSVKVTNGFYKGQTGRIVSHTWIYDGDCSIPGFVVRLDLNGEDVRISQFDLFVEE